MSADEVSRTFSAFADPTRRAILAMPSRGEATVNDIVAPDAMSLPAVSKHLHVLAKSRHD
ncbi:metalloregulator ArsR/SmtB family transcription factor [Paenarthrobacter sp. PH39-S1]|uniref:ArsR/SmtB family transcription factor n=1 Tax=Paenarthrobacter sp. PH39-S1 TaxID=3046204 RepID=UPI0024BB07BD|nr:metalloregulator ArsR/SmtB family transcription factor [Paenarthrobacter sp. PH39-S1]MDJ0356905.1 metalloregulator ArsR/SmtB family transcription factor [Paenarthrobacter sp. PH39-S1]